MYQTGNKELLFSFALEFAINMVEVCLEAPRWNSTFGFLVPCAADVHLLGDGSSNIIENSEFPLNTSKDS
jgi:hypothetical protein